MRLLITGGSGFIGTAFCQRAEAASIEWINLDIASPASGAYVENWRRVDILDGDALESTFREFRPTHVLHLAARTDTDSDDLADYEANTVGTLNVIDAAQKAPELERFVFTSTQFVLKPGIVQKTETHFAPHTTYGQSKVAGELATRAAFPDDIWAIVRPTNIWGPYHPRYGKEFLRVLANGQYLHPSHRSTVRTYGYVGTIADELLAVLSLDDPRVVGRVHYLGDPPILLSQWVDAFSMALKGKRARTVPYPVLKSIAIFGDGVTKSGRRFPLTSGRLRSMTEDYVTPTEATLALLDVVPTPMSVGVEETVAWFKSTTNAGGQPSLGSSG